MLCSILIILFYYYKLISVGDPKTSVEFKGIYLNIRKKFIYTNPDAVHYIIMDIY